ncbi:ClpP/crotonase-like domain-containing protein [Fennellomyces sp. T-0311]|nr:ClpP/crotonase-like domain-containing protein [Fennellomyces sp. T-0311]
MLSIDEEVVLVYSENIATMILNRPNKGNSLTPAMVEIFLDYLPKIADDTSIRALVITGSGEDFCTGLDISDDIWSPAESITQRLKWFSDKGSQLIEMLNSFPKAVIARINGPAIGAGVGLILASDIRLSVEEAYFSFSEPKIGFMPRLVPISAVNQVSKHRFSDYVLTGRHVSADEAAESFLNGVTETLDELDTKTKEYISLLVIPNPAAVANTKMLIDMIARGGDKDYQSCLNLIVQDVNSKIVRLNEKDTESVKSFNDAKSRPDCSHG